MEDKNKNSLENEQKTVVTINSDKIIDQTTEENNVANENLKYCVYCGNKIDEDTDYCKNCGRSCTDDNVRHCINCGEIVSEKQKFCPKCGSKVTNVVLSNKFKSINKKKTIGIMISLVLIVTLVVLGVINVPKLYISTEEHLSQGNYQKAYEKADDKEKTNVLIENLVADLSKYTKENLKDPDSFKLNNVWFERDEGNIVFEIKAKNSYGGVVSGYWYYYYSNDKKKYTLWDTVSDFDEETTYSWDDWDERTEKKFNNLTKNIVKKIITNDKLKLDDSIIERINKLNKNEKLKKVKLLNEVETIYPKDKDGKDA